MESLITKIQQEAASASYVDRKKLLDSLRDLQYSIESPEDTMQRLLHLNLQFAIIRIGLDLNLFNDILESKTPLTVDDLATKNSADPLLLGRILRYLSSLGFVTEVSKDTYASREYTSNLAKPEIQAGLSVYFEICNPAFQIMPSYLAETGYKNPDSFTDGIFNRAHKSDLPTFSIIHSDPSRSARFNLFMKAQRGSQTKCFSAYPFEEESRGWPAEKPLFVDVGGGAGHQTASFKKQFPDLPGLVILQDLPEPVEDARLVVPSDVKLMVHDFFEPQPIKGDETPNYDFFVPEIDWKLDAKYYYLRMILHDHTDENSIKILKHLTEAMGKDSFLLLDEMVLPTEHVDEVSMCADLSMMAIHSAMERSEEQWAKLVGAAGLKVDKVLMYAEGFNLGVVACVLE